MSSRGLDHEYVVRISLKKRVIPIFAVEKYPYQYVVLQNCIKNHQKSMSRSFSLLTEGKKKVKAKNIFAKILDKRSESTS